MKREPGVSNWNVPRTVDYAAAWLVPQTCVRCGEQTMHDSRVCGRCAESDLGTCTPQCGCDPAVVKLCLCGYRAPEARVLPPGV